MFDALYNQNPLMALAIEGDLACFFLIVAVVSVLWIYFTND